MRSSDVFARRSVAFHIPSTFLFSIFSDIIIIIVLVFFHFWVQFGATTFCGASAQKALSSWFPDEEVKFLHLSREDKRPRTQAHFCLLLCVNVENFVLPFARLGGSNFELDAGAGLLISVMDFHQELTTMITL